MRHRVCIVKWPLRKFERSFGTSSYVKQATENTDIGKISKINERRFYVTHNNHVANQHNQPKSIVTKKKKTKV